ncbi:MAG TPA: hypothetical protein VFV38_21640 [Ktedonobacteraceae bacterium]|nr:hypothetical protein [Ktedonobacteraceae bacterium]
MDESSQEIGPRVALWRSIIQGEQKSWVLFEHGTCLILMQPEAGLAAQARQIMSTWGPVKAGTASGDFNVISLPDPPGGWVVTGHHPDMLNYVSPADCSDASPSDLVVDLLGRGKRDQDAHALNIIHVEDSRSRT